MYQEILKYWFEEIDPSQWWSKDEHIDQVIIKGFLISMLKQFVVSYLSGEKKPKAG